MASDTGTELAVRYTDAPTAQPATASATTAPAAPAAATTTPPQPTVTADGKHVVEFHFDPAIQPEYFFEARPAVSVVNKAVVVKKPSLPFPFFTRLGLFLAFAALILFIVSVSTDEFTTQPRAAWTVTTSGTTHYVVASVRQGLWKTCISNVVVDGTAYSDDTYGPLCGRISNGWCGVSITHPSAGLVLDNDVGKCHDLQAERAFSLLAVFAAAAAVWFIWCFSSNESATKSRGAGSFFAFLAAVFGIISMSIAQHNMHDDDLAMNEYGSSFWELVVAWPLIFIASILVLLPRAKDEIEQKKYIGYFATALSLIVFVFYIVSISTREIVYTTTVSDSFDPTTHVPTIYYQRYTTGYWQTCTYNGTTAAGQAAGQSCVDIDSSCNTGNAVTDWGSCNTLRVIRTWVVIATVFSFFTFIIQYVAIIRTFHNMADAKKFGTEQVTQSRATIFAILLGLITPGLGYMATSLMVDFYVEDAGNWGFSFWLNMLAWVLGLISLVAFAYDYHLPHIRRILTALLLTFVGIVFMVTAIGMPHWAYTRTLPLFTDPFFNDPAFGEFHKPVQYGLWKICGLTGCHTIKSDHTCSVSGSGYDIYPCDTFNGLRSMALLAVLSCFFFLICQFSEFVILNKPVVQGQPRKSPRAARIASVFFGLLTVILGFLATVVGVNFFNVRTGEYAYSFWVWMVSWFLIIFSTCISIAPLLNDLHEASGVVLNLLAIVLFIIAAGSSQMVRQDTQGSYAVSRRMVSIGQFYVCSKETGGGDETCNFINTDCVPDNSAVALANCDEFNVIRAFNILAIGFAGLNIIPQLIHGCSNNAMTKKWSKWTVVGFSITAGLLGAVSMAAALDYFDARPTPFLGFSFWLQMVGWIVCLIAAALYACAGCVECRAATPAAARPASPVATSPAATTAAPSSVPAPAATTTTTA